MLVDTAAVEWKTLFVTHIFDGEEVVRGGKDGQTFVATFGDSRSAQRYVDAAKAGHLGAIYGFRRAELETSAKCPTCESPEPHRQPIESPCSDSWHTLNTKTEQEKQ